MILPLNIDPEICRLLKEQARANDEALLDYMARKLGEVALVPDTEISYTESAPNGRDFVYEISS